MFYNTGASDDNQSIQSFTEPKRQKTLCRHVLAGLKARPGGSDGVNTGMTGKPTKGSCRLRPAASQDVVHTVTLGPQYRNTWTQQALASCVAAANHEFGAMMFFDFCFPLCNGAREFNGRQRSQCSSIARLPDPP